MTIKTVRKIADRQTHASRGGHKRNENLFNYKSDLKKKIKKKKGYEKLLKRKRDIRHFFSTLFSFRSVFTDA